MKSLKIVIISPNSWNNLPVSKHHYAIELAKDNTVYFINPPTKNNKENFNEKGVFIINQYKRIMGLNKLPKFFGKILMQKEINSILNQTEEKNIDIIWSFDSSRLYHLDLFKAKVKIAHIVDYNEHFKFNELVSSADFCFATSDSIIEKMIVYNKNVYKINHGFYHHSKFNNDIEFVDNKKLSGAYIGNLNIQYLDWLAISKIVNVKLDINFYFIGSLRLEDDLKLNPHFSKVYNANNTYFIEAIQPESIVDVLESVNFCLLLYREKEFPLQLQNPHKIMQYLGSGSPIFGSYTYEFADKELIYMYSDVQTIEERFEAFLKNDKNHFSEESRHKRINFALDNTYPKQIERIFKLIKSKL